MDWQTANEVPSCYITRVDLTDKLGQRLIKLQKRREKCAKGQVDQLAEWWSNANKQDNNNDGGLSDEGEHEDDEFTVAPEDKELTAQMAALGLPTLLGGGSKHEVRASQKRRGRRSKKKATSILLESEAEVGNLVVVDASSLEGVEKHNEEPPSKSFWQPVWDANFCAFYWFNIQRQQSQWEVPEGLEEYAAALYASDQYDACEAGKGHSSEERQRDEPPSWEEKLASLEKTGLALTGAELLLERGGSPSMKGTNVQAGDDETGPPTQNSCLRGVPRHRGQQIRFEEDSESEKETNEALGELGKPKGDITVRSQWSEEGQGSDEGVRHRERKAGGIEGDEEGTLDPMEVDDLMEIDTVGGVDTGGGVWRFTEAFAQKGSPPQQEVVEAHSEEKVRQSREGSREDRLLSAREVSRLGECLLEATQKRSHAQLREANSAVIKCTARQKSAKIPSPTQQESGPRLQQGRSDAVVFPSAAANAPDDHEIKKLNQIRRVVLSQLDQLEEVSTAQPSADIIEDARKVEQVKRTAPKSDAGQGDLSMTSARASGIEQVEMSVVDSDTALHVISVTSALAVPGAGSDAGGAALMSSAGGREKPADVGQKYWFQRYRLFSKFDQGVHLDAEGWYSVTPEAIAKHHAKRCRGRIVVDAFAGVGGNAIQLATTANWVMAIDMDPSRLAYAEHNARVYGVRDKIEFIAGDFFKLTPHLKADALFLSPPWGGPDYNLVETYDLDSMLEPVSGVEMFKAGLQITSNIALFLPRNVDTKQLQELAWLANPPLSCEIESNYLCGKLKCITAYYGDLVSAPSITR